MRNGLLITSIMLGLVTMAMLSVTATPGAAATTRSASTSKDTLNVTRLLLAEPVVPPEGQQLLQVNLRNESEATVRAGLKVELRDKNDRRVGSALLRAITVNAQDEHRMFFRLKVPRDLGRYRLQFEVLSPDYKTPLLSGAPVYLASFAVGLAAQDGSAETIGGAAQAAAIGVPTYAPPETLRFELPDLLWENLIVLPKGVLTGQPLKIRADLRNVGGDIAREISVSVDYFDIRVPKRLQSVSRTKVLVLAPGDKVEMEFETVFPEDALEGRYNVLLQADVGDRVEESDETNNTISSPSPIRLSQINLVFPESGYAFEEAGLFLFRWDSLRYDEFKVQVSSDPNFRNPADFFDIPQGEKWLREKEVVPLEGELPGMAQGLLIKAGTTTLHWRVVGRESNSGKTGFSQILPFSIKFESVPDEEGTAPGQSTDLPTTERPAPRRLN